jgi:predicted nucleic acid-binding protein
MYISVLGLDETWYKIWEVLQKDTPKENRKSFKEFYSEIKQVLESIEGLSDDIKIIQFEKSLKTGIRQSVENIGTFDMRPRDAFHLAYMQDCGLTAIVSKDKKKFNQVSGIKVIDY